MAFRQKLGVVVLFQSVTLSLTGAESVYWLCRLSWAWLSLWPNSEETDGYIEMPCC